MWVPLEQKGVKDVCRLKHLPTQLALRLNLVRLMLFMSELFDTQDLSWLAWLKSDMLTNVR